MIGSRFIISDMPFIKHLLPGAQDPEAPWRGLSSYSFEQATTNSLCLIQINRSTYHAVKHHRMRSVTPAQNFNRERLLI